MLASVADEHPDVGDEDVAGEVIDGPDLCLGDRVAPVEISRRRLELRRLRGIIDVDCLASRGKISRANRVSGISPIYGRVLKTLNRGYRSEEAKPVGLHLVCDVESAHRDDSDQGGRGHRTTRKAHRK